MTTTAKPRPATKLKSASPKTLTVEYREMQVPDGEPFDIAWSHASDFAPEVQILGVDRREGPMRQAEEGHFEPTWINTYRYVLVWR